VVVNAIDFNRAGPWRALFGPALALMSHLEEQTVDPPWTFGGGTVLMLRFDHRLSKDIDLFVPDPQYLGHVNPRLGGFAEALTSEYEESAEFIKLLLPQGEIDIVVGSSLTETPYEAVDYGGRKIRVETCAEIIAKKMWHRGDQAKARDLFDLCAVAQFEPEAIERASPFMERHAAAFLRRLEARVVESEREFDAIDAKSFKTSFWECIAIAHAILEPLVPYSPYGTQTKVHR